jgi:hypothetical protein
MKAAMSEEQAELWAERLAPKIELLRADMQGLGLAAGGSGIMSLAAGNPGVVRRLRR